MSYRNVYTSERIMDNLAAENVRKAETRRLAQELRAGRQNWITRGVFQLGQQLARLLIAAGRKLEQVTLPPAELAEG